MSAAHLIVFTTAPNSEIANQIARVLIEENLAACVNLVPGVRSIYRWEGEIREDAEILCFIKTRSSKFEELRTRLVALHPYQVPEVLALEVASGHAPYLAWIDESCS